jgi:hypothetical protein
VRAIGPELTQYGGPNVLADPTLELHDGTGALIASNAVLLSLTLAHARVVCCHVSRGIRSNGLLD